jgi:NAD(P)-dependent dehydrogenase (short-subunit alcohol dehydrogenase family)
LSFSAKLAACIANKFAEQSKHRKMKKVWFITGSSRGLGRKITEVALGNGDLVAATALGKDDLNDVAEKYKDQVLLIELNVTDKSQIENAIEETVKRFGRIDVLVNNAGFGRP